MQEEKTGVHVSFKEGGYKQRCQALVLRMAEAVGFLRPLLAVCLLSQESGHHITATCAEILLLAEGFS